MTIPCFVSSEPVPTDPHHHYEELMYESGENAPHTGVYLFMRHQYETHCQPDQEEKEVPIEEGDEFPGCPVCDDPGYWRYLRAKDKD